MPQYTSPGMFEHRITDLIAPLVANFQRDGRTNAPDFIEVSSGTWDLARWATQDILAEKNTETGLTQDRVTWYRFRVGQLLERVREAFPNVKVKTWRTMHYPVNQAAETDYFMVRLHPLLTFASLLLIYFFVYFHLGQGLLASSCRNARTYGSFVFPQSYSSTRSSRSIATRFTYPRERRHCRRSSAS